MQKSLKLLLSLTKLSVVAEIFKLYYSLQYSVEAY